MSGKYWTHSLNPIIHNNCTCEVPNCWAKGMIRRFWPDLKPGEVLYNWPVMTRIPIGSKPRVYALNWLADIGHPSVDAKHVDDVFRTLDKINNLRLADQREPHTYLVLTKWPEDLSDLLCLPSDCFMDCFYIGTSVSDQQTADARIPHLMKFADNGWKVWLSIEPMIAPITLKDEWLSKFSQVIVGGETGHRPRRLDITWAKKVQIDCRLYRVPFFFKRWDSGKTGRELDGRTYDELAWGKV